MEKIIVEPEQLLDIARVMEQADEDYCNYYHLLYNEVEKMSSSWSGKDNQAFSEKIKSFEDDLRQISIILKEYCLFLRNAARAYRETQDELTLQAAHLKG